MQIVNKLALDKIASIYIQKSLLTYIPIHLTSRPMLTSRFYHYLRPIPTLCIFKSWPANYFSLNAVMEINEKTEMFAHKLVNLYKHDKKKLIEAKFLSHQSLLQVENLINKVIELEQEEQELETLQKEDSDSELKELAEKDLKHLKSKLISLNEEIFNNLIELHEDSPENEIYLEVSAGVGGQEAMLFAQDLFQMYQSFCLANGWHNDVISCETTPIGGIRHACLSVSGSGSYAMLKYEGGIHRVQRIPKTEKAGRVHTSTASVAVLPLPSEISVNLQTKDLKIETMRASGAGGQSVNKSESAIRITHLPSGFVTECQTSRSQESNRKEAMRKLRAKIYQQSLDEQEAKCLHQRKLQVGMRGRSEKIRTYNFPQDRIKDHRIGVTVHNMSEVLGGGSALHTLITELVREGKKERILEFLL